jgi:hypothetical protein
MGLLTRAGRSIVPKLAALADINDSEFFDHLAPKDRAALLRTLRDLMEAGFDASVVNEAIREAQVLVSGYTYKGFCASR